MKHLFVFFVLLALMMVSCSKPSQQQSTASGAPEVTGTYVFYRKNSAGPAVTRSSFGADVKVVEGTVSGLIIQKSPVKQAPSDKDPTKTMYSGSYVLINGKEIGAIDEQGVHKDGTAIVLLSVTQEGAPLDDIEILQLGANMPEGAFMFARTKQGGTVFRVGGTGKPTTSADTVLGEFRIDPKTKQGNLIPAVEVTSDSGPVTIPVKNLIAFKAQPPAPEKKP